MKEKKKYAKVNTTRLMIKFKLINFSFCDPYLELPVVSIETATDRNYQLHSTSEITNYFPYHLFVAISLFCINISKILPKTEKNQKKKKNNQTRISNNNKYNENACRSIESMTFNQ